MLGRGVELPQEQEDNTKRQIGRSQRSAVADDVVEVVIYKTLERKDGFLCFSHAHRGGEDDEDEDEEEGETGMEMKEFGPI
jgi:hypothetical protein